MRKLLSVFILLTVIPLYSFVNLDSRGHNLIGNVKSVKFYNVEYSRKENRFLEKKISHESHFNSLGKITRSVTYNNDGTVYCNWIFDKNTCTIMLKRIGSDVLHSKTFYTFNKEGENLKQVVYGSKGEVKRMKKYFYPRKNVQVISYLDNNGSNYSTLIILRSKKTGLPTVLYTKENGKPDCRIIFVDRGADKTITNYALYKGIKLPSEVYGKDKSEPIVEKITEGKLTSMKYKAVEKRYYESDSKGNWIKKTVKKINSQGDLETVKAVYRDIEYH